MANIAVFLEKNGKFPPPTVISSIRTAREIATQWGATLYGIAIVQESSQLPNFIKFSAIEGIDKIIGIISPLNNLPLTSSVSLSHILSSIMLRYSINMLLFGTDIGTYELATSLSSINNSYFLSDLKLTKDNGELKLLHYLPQSNNIIRLGLYDLDKTIVALVNTAPYEKSRGSETEIETIVTWENKDFKDFSWLFIESPYLTSDATFFLLAGEKAQSHYDELIEWSKNTNIPVFFTSQNVTSPWGRISHSNIPLTANSLILLGLSEKELQTTLPFIHRISRILLVDSTIPSNKTFPSILSWEGTLDVFIKKLLMEYGL